MASRDEQSVFTKARQGIPRRYPLKAVGECRLASFGDCWSARASLSLLAWASAYGANLLAASRLRWLTCVKGCHQAAGMLFGGHWLGALAAQGAPFGLGEALCRR